MRWVFPTSVGVFPITMPAIAANTVSPRAWGCLALGLKLKYFNLVHYFQNAYR